jgi:hypothetical protein
MKKQPFDLVLSMESTLDSPMSRKIAKRKVVVFKTLADSTMIKAAAEKVKSDLFRKYMFIKTQADQIRQIAFEKTYEPYFVVEGKYTIDYYQGRIYILELLDNSTEVVLLNHTFKPKSAKEKWQKRTLKIDGEERLIYERTACLVLDRKGREVSPEHIHSAPQEKRYKKILAEFEDKKKMKFGSKWEEKELKSRIAKRPLNVKRIVKETLEISNRRLFYVPVYKIWFQNTKTGEEKEVNFDGVTAKMIS